MYQLIVVPLISILIIGLAMVFVIEQPISWLLEVLTNWLNSLGNTSGLMFGLIIGVMMAADMGGPINKSISTFSIGLMSAGVNAPIAACMAAGMTPPLGIALATLLFKKNLRKKNGLLVNPVGCLVLLILQKERFLRSFRSDSSHSELDSWLCYCSGYLNGCRCHIHCSSWWDLGHADT